MKYVIGIIVAIALVGGGYYYMNMQSDSGAAMQQETAQDSANGPSGAAGVNGSANQGNLGGTDTGVVQQPGADGAEGSVIGANLALGVDGTASALHLIAYNGMTVYTFTKDTGAESTCYDTCATNWPPYIVGAEDNLTQLQAGVTGKVGTTIRKDKTIQVTYNGHPLYFYVKDTKSGDTTGDKVGGVWFVVKP